MELEECTKLVSEGVLAYEYHSTESHVIGSPGFADIRLDFKEEAGSQACGRQGFLAVRQLLDPP